MTAQAMRSSARACGAAALYGVAVFLAVFSFAMTVEADNPAAFPGRHDSDGAFGAVVCVTLAAAAAVGAMTTLSRGRLSKVVCVAIVAACVYRVISVSGQL
ncbi:hypothetical protein [Streptomyces longispororuber]|uniref:hypothetical protein n=1 Tax=Streptomyces longispororuber TaxID=68230 RepID=UPI00210E7D31|nr:hypothetical protein [Streptomyces longispororuber]MCQ4209816.1 hypothetical protein [Streptomyces longispororuber]